MPAVEPKVLIQAADFDAAAEIAAASATGAGAVVTFTGVCRDEGGSLAALELEHYPGMAEAEIMRIAREAADRWPLSAVTAIHRHGRIEAGQNIVLVVTASSHRRAAFDAAVFLMDYLKTRAPFWKKEHRRDGSDGGWVESREQDADALARWTTQDPH